VSRIVTNATALPASAPANRYFTYAMLAVTVGLALFWPLKPRVFYPFIIWDSNVWFSTLAMVALAFGRLSGIRHVIAIPEAFFITSPFWVLLRIFPSSKVPSVDELLLAFDRSFGYGEASLGRWFAAVPAVDHFFSLVYCGLPLAVALQYLALPSLQARRRFGIAVLLAAFLVVPFFVACPAAGPGYLLRSDWPGSVYAPAHPVAKIIPNVALNTTPSDHFAWALVILWFAWKYCGWKVRAAALLFAICTVLATLGTGEHYIIDLVLSVPFVAAILALVDREWKRAGCLFLALLVWNVSLRQGWALPLAPPAVWLLCGLTFAVSCWRPGRAGESAERIRPPVPAAL